VKQFNFKKLGKFVKQRMEELCLKDRDIERKTKKAVSSGTVNRITNVKNNDIEFGSLYGIAIGIKVPVEHLVALLLDLNPQERNLLSAEEQSLIDNFRRLPFDKQDFILQTVQSLCAQIPTTAMDGMRASAEPHQMLINPVPTSTHKKGGR
jgi:hypothetical protein